MDQAGPNPFYELAGLYGIETAYHDVNGHPHYASPEELLAALNAFGAPMRGEADAGAAARERRLAIWSRPVEPVCVAWDGNHLSFDVKLPADSEDVVRARLTLESGKQQTFEWQAGQLPVNASAEIEGRSFVSRRITIRRSLPSGYHSLVIEGAGVPAESLIIATPRKCYLPCEGDDARIWGLFLPLYSLYSARSWGCGDFSDLDRFLQWTAGFGGRLVGTLPVLASFVDGEPFEPSPYAPASRLFWNEMYVDVTRAPEYARCRGAQDIVSSTDFQTELGEMRASSVVDYRCQMALKRRVLEELSRNCFDEDYDRRGDVQQFVRDYPRSKDYARFRAVCRKRGAPWQTWPAPLRDGILSEGDYDQQDAQYYIYTQMLASEQIRDVSAKARDRGVKLYFDLPLGAHPDGYDIWRERASFACGISAGAPPDPFHSQGQDWGFPPLHPERLREQGYRYLIDCLRHQMKYAGVLRIDHVMGLHRLFWVSNGMKPTQGVYVKYHPDEVYAILSLESHRNKSMIVGEDLGTVPPEVRPAMTEHGLHRSYVVQFSMRPVPPSPLEHISGDMAATVNTHDLPPFAAFWKGQDIQERVQSGLIQKPAAEWEMGSREAARNALVSFLQRRHPSTGGSADLQSTLAALLAYLGESPAHIVLLNLEDLWLETRPQNRPGTHGEGATNWSRKARYSFEQFSKLLPVQDMLRRVDFERRKTAT